MDREKLVKIIMSIKRLNLAAFNGCFFNSTDFIRVFFMAEMY